MITLGVRDLARARRFYEAVGWETGAAPDDDVVFFQAGDMVLALWDRERLAEDSAVEDAPGWGVDDAIAQMRVIDALWRSQQSERWEEVA